MMKYVLIAALAIGVLPVSLARGSELVQWAVADGGNGHYYELFDISDGTKSWTVAKLLAEGLTFQGVQGHLATISSVEESSFISDLISPYGSAWVGLTDHPSYGGSESIGQSNPKLDGWVWVDGTPLSDTPELAGLWDLDEPNDNDPFDNGDFLSVSSGGTWSDQYNFANNYVVEYNTVPEPSAFALLGITFVALAVVRRPRRDRR